MKRFYIFLFLFSIVSLLHANTISVTVTTAGTLKSEILKQVSDYFSVTDLVISGPLNGDDIFTLRSMATPPGVSINEGRKLAALDLSNATIVEGGISYYNYSHFTKKDVFPEYSFSGCATITTVILPNSVTKIGENAFENCYQLTTVTIPDNVTVIYKSVFFNCRSLTSVSVSKNMKWIGDHSFDGCRALSSLLIPNSVSHIGEYAFCNCGFTSFSIPDQLTSIENGVFYLCDSLTAITIPEGVTSIGNYAFFKCEKLSSIIIPKNVASIGENAFEFSGLTSIRILNDNALLGKRAFYYCDKLMSINIPDNLTTIIEGLFAHCHNLKSITIPSQVTTLESCAFYGCASLISINIPNKVTSIRDSAFYECRSLPSIKFPDGLTSIGSFAFYYCYNIDSLSLPNSMASIGNWAFFYCTKVTSVSIPKCLYSINKGIFQDCRQLSSIVIPKYVMRIDEEAFSGCEKLADITCYAKQPPYLYANVFDKVNKSTCILTVMDSSLAGYSSAKQWRDFKKKVTIPTVDISISVTLTEPGTLKTEIEKQVLDYLTVTNLTVSGPLNGTDMLTLRQMAGCNQTDSSLFPGEMTILDLENASIVAGGNSYYLNETTVANTFPNNLFYQCIHLETINLPKSITTIGSYAFSKCKSLTSIEIPAGVKIIGDNAFYECIRLSSIKIPDGVTVFKSYCFGSCDSLTSINIPESLTSIGEYAFVSCRALKSITIPNSVDSIGKYAFFNCNNFTSIIIPDSIKILEAGIFRNCENLSSVYLPENLTTIGSEAFYSCSKLTSFSIPGKVTSIGLSAFSWCDGLTSINIFESMTFIDKWAFKNCSNLSEIKCYAINPPTLGKTVFEGVNKETCVLKVLENSLKSYSAAVQWKDFANIETLKSNKGSLSVNVIEAGSLKSEIEKQNPDFFTITDLTISGPLNGTDILTLRQLTGQNITKSCSIDGVKITLDLTNASIVSGGENYFENKTTSNDIFPNYAFINCQDLTSITLPNSITSIGNNAFSGCSGLITVNILDRVNSIESSAFSNCSNLSEIACRAINPPSLGTTVFSGVDTKTCVLKMPASTLEIYSVADQWKDFVNKETFTPVSSTNLTKTKLHCRVLKNRVLLTCTIPIKSVELLNMKGMIVGKINDNSLETFIQTDEKGMLLVRVQTADNNVQIYKVMIKE